MDRFAQEFGLVAPVPDQEEDYLETIANRNDDDDDDFKIGLQFNLKKVAVVASKAVRRARIQCTIASAAALARSDDTAISINATLH